MCLCRRGNSSYSDVPVLGVKGGRGERNQQRPYPTNSKRLYVETPHVFAVAFAVVRLGLG